MRLLVLGTNVDKPEAYILCGLQRLGVSVHYVGTPIPDHLKLMQEAGIKVTNFTFAHRFDLKGIKLIRKVVRDEKIDLIYALSNRSLSCSVLGLVGTSLPIATYRGTVGHLSWLDPTSWLTYLNPKVKKILCVSEAVERYLIEMRVAREKVTTIYKGHDISWYQSPPPPRSDLGIPEDAFVVGCTAMMRPVKGVDVLLKAVTSLLSELPELHLLLVGGIKDPEIERLIREFPDTSRIHLTGYRTDAARLARLSDVVVMASKTREGFPKSIIEAMAQGVPAIVTEVGGMPELVGHGSAGVMIKPSDVDALARALREGYNDRTKLRAIGILGQKRIQEVFNIETTVRRTFEEFSALIGDEATPRSSAAVV
jgi:glycosyltransferase involved in cell wall biosynthesis